MTTKVETKLLEYLERFGKPFPVYEVPETDWVEAIELALKTGKPYVPARGKPDRVL